jgi:hypothetical protein
MNLKVLKNPSSVVHIHGNNQSMFYSACRATIGYTLNARCVLQYGITVSMYCIGKRPFMSNTPVLCLYDGKPIKWLLYKRIRRNTGISEMVIPVLP